MTKSVDAKNLRKAAIYLQRYADTRDAVLMGDDRREAEALIPELNDLADRLDFILGERERL